jgi:uncharacterized protein (TIGR00730 family)
MSTSARHCISVCAVLLHNQQGQLLTVRKRGTEWYQLPGGKPEAGECPEQTVLRECAEELEVALNPSLLRRVGTYRGPAANEPGEDVQAIVFTHPPVPVPGPAAEIAQLRWLDPAETPLPADVAPLLAGSILPAQGLPVRALARRWVTIYTGSASGTDPRYAEAAARLGTDLANAGVGIAYGGGAVGLMRQVADAALAARGRVVGVMPQVLVDGEIAHPGLTRLEVVPDMAQRKLRMEELADLFVALPGGSGTLEEFFEAWTWQQLGIHTKPVALYDVDGYWQPLLNMIDRMVERGFLDARYRESLIVARTPRELLTAWDRWQAPQVKWGS